MKYEEPRLMIFFTEEDIVTTSLTEGSSSGDVTVWPPKKTTLTIDEW